MLLLLQANTQEHRKLSYSRTWFAGKVFANRLQSSSRVKHASCRTCVSSSTSRTSKETIHQRTGPFATEDLPSWRLKDSSQQPPSKASAAARFLTCAALRPLHTLPNPCRCSATKSQLVSKDFSGPSGCLLLNLGQRDTADPPLWLASVSSGRSGKDGLEDRICCAPHRG